MILVCFPDIQKYNKKVKAYTCLQFDITLSRKYKELVEFPLGMAMYNYPDDLFLYEIDPH